MISTRDCVVLYYGDRQTVVVDDSMIHFGWSGGQGVMWAPSVYDIRKVTFSDGLFGGFLVWGSDETGDDYTASTRNQIYYRFATMFSGGCLVATSTYERYTYASRTGGGPLVPIIYTPNNPLYFSSRGWFTNEDEMTLSGHPLAPAISLGYVARIPKPATDHFLTVQTSM